MSLNNRNTCPNIRIKNVDVKCDPSLSQEGGDINGPEPTLVTNEYGTAEWQKPDFSLYDTEGVPYRVTLTLEIEPGTWETEGMLLSFLRVQAVQSFDETVSVDMSTGKIPFTESSYKNIVEDYKIGSVTVSQDIDGNDVVNRFFTFEFLLSQKPQHLNYYASCFLDYDSLSTSLGISLPESSRVAMYGDIVKKEILDGGVFLQTVNGVFDQKNQPYTDETHIDIKGNLRTGVLVNDSLMVSDLTGLLSTWLERDVTTTAGLYYSDLLAVVNARGDLLRETKRLLEKWTVRDPNFTAGKYYLDLKKVYDYYSAVSGSEKLLTQRLVPNFGVTIDETECRRYELICNFNGDPNFISSPQSLEDYLARKESETDMYFANLAVTVGETDNVFTHGPAKLFFSFDLSGFLTSQIKNSCLLANTNKSIMDEFIQFVNIKSLTIERTRVDGDYPKEIVVIGNPNSSGVIKGASRKNGQVMAAIQEVQNVQIEDTAPPEDSAYGVSYYRHFSIKDNYIADQKIGEYMYSATIIFEDKTDDFIKSRLFALASAKISIEEYYNTSLLSCSFNDQTNSFTEAFLKNQYSAYQQGKSPWLLAPATFADVLRCFYDVTDEEAYMAASEMFTRLDPQSSSPDKILSILKEFEIMESEISQKFDINNHMGDSAGSSPKNKIRSNLYQAQHDFKDDIEILDLNNTNASEVTGPSEVVDNYDIPTAFDATQSIGATSLAKTIFGAT